ncbi:MAG: hypothetical protein M5U26_20165 [Planctomycetota bacterium]|nr:hypothetical protein [Planctomycetota bacterium]
MPIRFALLALLLCGLRAAAGESASLNGTVRFEGELPEPFRFDLSISARDLPVCSAGQDALRPSNRLQVDSDSRGVRNAVLRLSALDGGTPAGAKPFPAERVPRIDQRACAYEPFVSWVQAGGKLELHSSDDTLHNVHAYRGKIGGETLFNVAMPVKGQTLTKTFEDEGLAVLACDAGHVWMCAYVFVTSNPYIALSGADGRFGLDGVPPGRYKASFWHAGWKVTPVGTNPETGKPRGYAYAEPFEWETRVTLAAGENTLDAVLTPDGWKKPEPKPEP